MKYCSNPNCDIAENDSGRLVWKRKIEAGEIAHICRDHKLILDGEKTVSCPFCQGKIIRRAAIQAIAMLKALQLVTPIPVSITPIQCPHCKEPLKELSEKLRKELRI